MTGDHTAPDAAGLLARIRQMRPVVQCITNAVTANDCANMLLAVGASPTMAHHPLEAAEIAEHASALVCNFGAVEDYEAMRIAGARAVELGHPVIVDPVGVGASGFRRDACLAFFDRIHPSCVRGNRSELLALMENRGTAAGVDAAPETGLDEAFIRKLRAFARERGTIAAASGSTDVITDGKNVYLCENGHPLMARITGSGCMSSALLGAFLSMEKTAESAAACCAFIGIAGELAAKAGGGTMTFRSGLIDAASLMTPEQIRGKERVNVWNR